MERFPNTAMRDVLSSINFVERYQSLCAQYDFSVEEGFGNYDNQRVLEILLEVGYQNVKFWKSENFFRSTNKHGIYEFWYHIETKSGMIDLMWYARRDKKYYAGDRLTNLVRFLFKSEKIYPMPVFRNYEELKDFLTVGYQLQEDITAAFLKAQGISD
ncbi:hypothetical protein [Selenomonas artemidis]|uniref:Uncharacterized protein n=1 Tax=Selenomonas artemidis F0399 TaxID=749551 RepID=E7N4L2_9FIRM|nr:hypothetical protein [Selenomonas artemidis]EFW28884.1 hypothetical protein HMPREF9555_01956 [Selenomonas artemidis F0399]